MKCTEVKKATISLQYVFDEVSRKLSIKNPFKELWPNIETITSNTGCVLTTIERRRAQVFCPLDL
jgi:hypothetical protein